jgi:hypothetical protein
VAASVALSRASSSGGFLKLAASAALALLLLLAWLPRVTAARRGGSIADELFSPDTVLLLWSRACWETLMRGDVLNVPCLTKVASRGIGLGLMAGAFIVKLPQIVAFVRAGSVAGASLSSAYAEAVGYALTVIFHVANGSPFLAYGEACVVAVQSLAIVVLMWAYAWPGAARAGVAAAALAAIAAAAAAAAAEPAYLRRVQDAATLLFAASRLVQVAANVRQGGTGTQAFLTLFMNFGGSAARIFTSIVEVRDRPEVLISFLVSTALNGTLLAQYVYFNFIAAAARKAPAVAAAAVAPAKRGGKAKAA